MTHFNFAELNIWAILTVSVINMIIGAFWYSRGFLGKTWMKGLGLKDEDMKAVPVNFVIVFVLGLIIAIFMALFLQGVNNAAVGLAYGAILALAFVIPTMLTHYIMEGKKGGFMMVVAGHELVVFLIYGAILGGWQ